MYPTEINNYAKERINEMIKAREEHDLWLKLASQQEESISPTARFAAWWQGLTGKPQRRLKRSR